jgi:6-phosphogluconate dehydrogenase
LLSNLLHASAEDLSRIFRLWNEGDLDSYLVEITADILQQRDPEHPEAFFVDYVLDSAEQKGTGKWTSINALDMGIPTNSIAEAVFARCLSALKSERGAASHYLTGPVYQYDGDRNELITAVHDALYCSKICAYAQGFQLMRAAEAEYGWKLDFGSIASIWRGGCIIRARFLQKITDAYTRDPRLVNLLLDPYFKDQIQNNQTRWRSVVALAAQAGVSAPAFMSALAYYDGYRSGQLPANLLQAQRDYFGAHTYERIDQPRGTYFHLDWSKPERRQSKISH